MGRGRRAWRSGEPAARPLPEPVSDLLFILDRQANQGHDVLFEICSRLAMRHGLTSSRQAVSQHWTSWRPSAWSSPAGRIATSPPFRQRPLEHIAEHRWLTVVSPYDADGTELVLEPDAYPAAKIFKKTLVSDGIPYTSFAVSDVAAEFARLERLGVRFTQESAAMGR